tara:strand:+ start:323 stop:523 length:201 start_codon:yes stop_codon:yes gene_type:complete
MSREEISTNQTIGTSDAEEKIIKAKVDINVLLNKVRAEKKKEKTENFIFLSLVSLVIIVTGIIISL